ncbi:M1 family aminopeptidase [Sandaracinus amylolyticus]|uniref:M1 family aminopeptidase n=1 Tax=Sandaracinus amylolyticus TaxID=927083 RepID=UPI001F174B1B|nr:M1 family aminopeptidase [Sandaracinus amylolyticus]UJR79309.1 Putative metallopeptidase [Sandaracinus amylolyticus]
MPWIVLLALAALACDPDDPPIPPDATTPPCPQDPGAPVVRATALEIDLASDRVRTTHSMRSEGEGTCCTSLACEPEIDGARWNDAPVDAARTATSIEACGPCTCTEDAALAIESTLPLHVVPGTDAGFQRITDAAGRGYTRLAAWLGTCGSIVPCDATIGVLQDVTIDVHHAPEQVVLCPGARTLVAADRTRCAVTAAPPYVALAFAASDAWTSRPFVEFDDTRVVFFEPSGGRVAASIDPDAVAAFVRWLVAELGPLPYGDELRVATMPSTWLGYEHPANIVLNDMLATRADTGYPSPALHVLLHEIAHQWAGDRTTPASMADFAWKESIAEYLVYVFEDEHRPAGEADATRATWHRSARFSPAYPRPIDDPSPEVIRAVAYGLAPMATFLQLEPLVGREALLRAITAFLREPGARDTAALIAEIERASGHDLDGYTSAWIVGAGEPPLPHLVASVVELGAGRAELTITQDGPGDRAFPMQVEVRVTSAGREVIAHVDFGLAPTSRVARTTIELEGTPTAVEIDPDDRLADSPVPWEARPAAPPRPTPLEL